MRARGLTLLLVVAGLATACTTSVEQSPSPPTDSPPTDRPDAVATCPELQVDPQASLGPEFDEESLAPGAADDIAAGFVAVLEGLYADDPDADPCVEFTDTGLTQAAAVDDRLGQAMAGTSRLYADLALRLAGEGTYDLRQRPPKVPLQVVFDIPAGSTTTDVASGATDTTLAPERVALDVTFAYDGTKWVADHVESVPPADAARWAIPTPAADLGRCKGFHNDPDKAAFDNAAGGSGIGTDRQRQWCADGGDGPSLDELVALRTRWPCGETRVAVLSLGLPLGTPSDPLDPHEYIRDPRGEAFKRGWLDDHWTHGVQLPDDAEDTGWTNGNMDLWVDPSEVEEAVYVRTAGAFERWPRGSDSSVTDCN
jgi:hypothetical protein